MVAHAKFASVNTGRSWEEDFIYRLSGFDAQGKIGHWEIWADPLSAWQAVGDGDGDGDGDASQHASTDEFNGDLGACHESG